MNVVRADPMLRIVSVIKRFGGFTAVDSLSLDIAKGEFFALLGPSGCGKTTLLRMLAGFETPDAGEIYLNSENIAQVPPHLRPVNMMFQNYALFPHLTVAANIAFGLKRMDMPKTDIDSRVKEMISLVRLEGLEARKPDQLSGGQRQRVALARSLARRPQMLLLDEPLAALDKKLREITQDELKEVQRRLGMTFIIVTHDQSEAMTVADRIGVMDKGQLVQVATPRQLYEAPNSRWIAGFVGDINLIEGKITSRDMNRVVVTTSSLGDVITTHAPAGAKDVCVAIRPEKIRLSHSILTKPATDNTFDAELIDVRFLGGVSICKVKLTSGEMLRVAMTNATRASAESFTAGQRISVSFATEDIVVLDR
ncbi:MAG: ABC transporter ATP-binding protein [Afipia sp.]|nr:ABC transporter ATP-binding protein [Afipia sp.]